MSAVASIPISVLTTHILDLCQLGIVVLNKKREVIFWNAWMKRASNLDREQVLGKSLETIFPAMKDRRLFKAIDDALTKGISALLSQTLHRNPLPLVTLPSPDDPQETTMEQSIMVSPLIISATEHYCLIQILDVTASVRRERLLRKKHQEAQRAQQDAEQAQQAAEKARRHLELINQELQRLSTIDPLTGVANRRRFEEFFEQQWRATLREHQPLSIILIDIDYFKRYNDYYGHQGGDACLRQVAEALRGSVERPLDLVARYGGEEFVTLLPNTDAKGALQVAEKQRRMIEQLGIPHPQTTGNLLTISGGTATIYPTRQAKPQDVVAAADKALYQAKSEGRNRIISAGVISAKGA